MTVYFTKPIYSNGQDWLHVKDAIPRMGGYVLVTENYGQKSQTFYPTHMIEKIEL